MRPGSGIPATETAAELKGGVKGMASSQLYPPLIDKSLPAFVVAAAKDDENATYSGSINIYFAPAIFNSIKEIAQIQLTLRIRSNNENALNSDYVSRIKVINMADVGVVSLADDPVLALSDYKYYVTLSETDLADGSWATYNTYKVQLRAGDETARANIDNFSGVSKFQDNQEHFSEWSTVCLIRPIEEPTFSVITLEDDNDDELTINESVNTFFTSIDSDFIGSYTQPDPSEPLKNWRMMLYDATETNVLADSGWNIFNSYDYMTTEEKGAVAFERHLKYQMEDATSYVLILYVETKNGYKSSKKYSFSTMVSSGEELGAAVSSEINEEEAYAIVNVVSNDNIKQYTNVTIRRTSSRSNFTIWEDICTKTFAGEILTWTFHDFTVESGVFYRYGVQRRDIRGRRGKLEMTDLVMGEWEDAFLVGQGQQLKLKFDFVVNNKSITVSESKTDTIGSKYPYVRRNGYMYYKNLTVSGLIAECMDQADLFTTDARLYNHTEKLYKNINDQVNLFVNTYDYTYEREFRHAVMTFLYDNNVKLFKSAQEGNILVKLMNISLTPKTELGRLLYQFSATLVEVDEYTIENCDKYNIQAIGNYRTDIEAQTEMMGQLQIQASPSIDFVQIIKDKYSNGREIVNDVDFSDFRIEISDESKPNKIDIDNPTGEIILSASAEDEPHYVLGWVFILNDDTPIVVTYPRNIYELDARYVDIQSLTLAPDQDSAPTTLIKYVGALYKSSDVKLPIRYINQKVYGQIFGVFAAGENVIDLLKQKYHLLNDNYTIDLTDVYHLDIQAVEGTEFNLRTSTMNAANTIKMNPTEYLLIDPDTAGVTINELTFTKDSGAIINYYAQVQKGVY